MKNKLVDLNNHLFAQLERLSDESLKGSQLQEELERAKAIANVAREIIGNGNLVLKAHQAFGDGVIKTIPPMLEDKS